MKRSVFLVDYVDGQPDLYGDEVFYQDEQGNWKGGWSVLDEVTTPNQEDVRMLIETNIEKMTALKENSRFEWVEDLEDSQELPVEEVPEGSIPEE